MRLIFLYVFVFISCETKVDTHQSNMELLDDVVKIHDELMVKMKDLLSTTERAEVIKKNGISNEMFQFSSLG